MKPTTGNNRIVFLRAAGAMVAVAAALALPGCGGEDEQQPQRIGQGNWQRDAAGVTVALSEGEFAALRLQVIDDATIRVTAGSSPSFSELPEAMMVVAEAGDAAFAVEESDRRLRLDAGRLVASVDLESGAVRFSDAEGRLLLEEAGRSKSGKGYALRQRFRSTEGESYYGLGQRQDGRVDLAGENVELTTHNIIITIPFLTSTQGYGLLWNNASISRAGSPVAAAPLAESFELRDADGNPGGLTARYFDGDELLLERVETDLDYQFLARASEREVPFPDEVADAENLRIEWRGSLVPARSGEYELKMYSSGYARLSIDGEALLDRWRMNWNPWFHNAKVKLEAGKAHTIDIDWTTQGGYFRLLQHAPQAAEEAGTWSLAADAGSAIDYYVVAGADADEVVAGYRRLTGQATMLPKWAFGFWQSRERYKSQDELLDVLKEYRSREIPIDNIVLDWSYWPVDAWGSHDFDPEFFPDPGGLVEQVHELDARIMISVWPKFYPETAHYKALNAKGCMFNKNIEEENFDWIYPGYLNAFYDAFEPACRQLYWEQLRDSLNVHGFDAWWLDAVEPDMHSNLSFEHRKDAMTPNAAGSGAEFFNAYALPHAETVFAGDREADPDVRTFILTRSGYGGIQRTGSAIWSGDIVTRWSNLADQVAAGISVGLSGMPYWTFDIGGFTPEDHYRYFSGGAVGNFKEMPAEHQEEWQEINLRWFQFGSLSPLFRSHGQNPYREIFNLADEGTPVYDSLVWHTELRYRLMPYIYTLAGNAYHEGGTLMRGLVMDFPDDPEVRDIADQYLFGPSLLVSPVTEYRARSRAVYLPAGSEWYDFHSGRRHAGGQRVEADAPLERMPLFVPAGAIIPTGPAIRHTGESLNAPLTINVYTGADGRFDIYEDDGLSYGYERGEWSRIPVSWDDAAGVLTIGERQGGFDGMAEERQVAIRWISGTSVPADFAAKAQVELTYRGDALTVSFER